MTIENMQELLEEELKDLLSAETQLVKALPRVAKACESEELQSAIMEHLEETKTQVERLKEVFGALEKTARAKKCKAMEGLLEEAKEIMDEDMAPAIKDMAIIGGCQKIEHYEIASYGTAVALAQRLELEEVAGLLQQTLDEEKAADEKLTDIAAELQETGEADESTEEAGKGEEPEEEPVAPHPMRKSPGRGAR